MANRHCCVPHCSNGDRKNNAVNQLSFFTIPKGAEIRKSWVIAIRRDEGKYFRINDKYTVVCSAHFKSEDIRKSINGKRQLKPGAVPSVFQWSKSKQERKTRTSHSLTSGSDTPLTCKSDTLLTCDSDILTCDSEPSTSLASKGEPVAAIDFHDYAVQPILTAEEKLQEAIQYIEKLEKQNKELSLEKFCVNKFCHDDKMIRFYTGFATYDHLEAIFRALQPTAITMTRWSQVQRQRNTNASIREDTFRCEKLNLFNQMFLFLCYVRQGLPELDLSVKFGVSQSTVSRIVITWANYLYFVLGSMQLWASRETIDRVMPQCFKDTYPRTRVILDCTEVKTQTPSSLFINSQMYSNYKGTVTLKCLIGIAPHGAVSFVSELFTGSISDNEITARSGILDLLEPLDGVMVDKGFTIEKELKPRKCHIVIPPFLTNTRNQFSKEEVELTQKIARLRIHVERAIRRVKEYRLFDKVIPLAIVGSVNQLWTVCVLMTNFQGPLF